MGWVGTMPSDVPLTGVHQDRETTIDELKRELAEALEQQTATSDVLSVISSSPGELAPVFNAMLANAVRICNAKFGFMNRYDGDIWKIAAVHGAAPAYTEYLQQHGYKRPGPETIVSRIARTKQMVHIADLAASRGYAERDAVVVAAVELGGVRTLLGVPMLKKDELIGAILLYHQEVRPFTEKQIELVTNFANKAVIAIENTRLFEAEQASKRELQESLEYQTATSEILGVISRSPTDLKPVLDAILATAARLCSAEKATIRRREGNVYAMVAEFGFTAEQQAYMRANPVAAGSGTVVGRAAETRRPVYIPDVETAVGFTQHDLARGAGFRAGLAVPLLREGDVIGVLMLLHSLPDPFTADHIERAQTFADQAVIAIENTRLFEEVQARNTELRMAL